MRSMRKSPVERRVHRVYVTHNSEYHVRKDVCVGVLDRQRGAWVDDHPAVGRSIGGTIRYVSGGILPSVGEPRIGDALYFRRGERDLVTSRVESIERPPKHVVAAYRN